MKKIILIAINLVVFVLLRLTSVFAAFLFFGIGASASSDKYTPYILIPSLLIQLVLITILYSKKKFITEKIEFVVLILMTLALFSIGKMGLFPF